MTLTFHGGAGSVTGANYLLESGETKILIDCGLEQGSRYAERQNFEPFPYDPKEITAVFLTHPHLDHVGRIPKLSRDGFRGVVYSTPPAKDLAELVLLDSEHILRKEAERDGREPLYDEETVHEVMAHWEGAPYHTPVREGPFTITLYDAGHTLGSAIIKVEVTETPTPPDVGGHGGVGSRPPRRTSGDVGSKTIVFSGDLGNFPAPIIKPTELLTSADYCVVESTYGDRVHGDTSKRREEFEDVIEDVVRRKGVLIIPAFALERTQELLYHLHQLFLEGRVPKTPVFIDSPLAIKMTAIYKKYEDYFNAENYELAKSGDDILNFPELRLTLSTEQSKEINRVPPPKIVIAGSGMSHGGRILHHELRYLPDPKSTILLVGYQAVGSLGRQILDGAKEVTIMGEKVSVRAERRVIQSYSAHADQPRLLEWLRPLRATLKTAFVVQGEPPASEALAQKIRDELAVMAVIPKPHESFVL